jgi:hypothetical protein
MTTALKTLVIVLMVILVASCPLLQRDYSIQDPGDDVEIPDDGFGVLEINFGTSLDSAKSLPTPITMEIGSYTITGMLDGGGSSFDVPGQTGGSFTQNGLIPGLWNITVNAFNTDDPPVTIGRGTTTAQISAGAITSVQITILPLPGDGTLEVTAQWSKDVFKKGERVDAVIFPIPPAYAPDGSLLFSDPGTQGAYRYSSFSSDPIPAGYYLITLQLFVDDVLQKTIVEALRIISGQKTSGTLTFPLQ